jgi:glycolate dehydrogenase FAD-linked subunit
MTEDIMEMTRLCSACYKMCRDNCSVAGATRKESDAPQNRAFFAEGVMKGKRELTPEVVDYFYRCSLCGACREACETGQDTGEIMLNARRELDEGLLPERLKELKEKIVKNNLYGKDSKKVKDIFSNQVEKKSAKTLIYFSKRVRTESADTVIALFSLLNKLKVDFAVLDDDPDTGHLLYSLGFTKDATTVAKDFAKNIVSERKTNPSLETLVIVTADDLRMISKTFPTLGVDIKDINIVSLPEFLLKILKDKKPSFESSKKSSAKKITYHDPCGLGRELRIFEAPREIIKMVNGSEFVELPFSKDRAPCCGYGMGLSYIHPEVTSKMAERILSIGSMTDADTMVMGCSTCRDVVLENIPKDTKSTKNRRIDIVDLPIFLDRIVK